MPFIKIEVQKKEGYNTLLITPRDEDSATLEQMDLIQHAIFSMQPKVGGYVMGTNILKIDVRTADQAPVEGLTIGETNDSD